MIVSVEFWRKYRTLLLLLTALTAVLLLPLPGRNLRLVLVTEDGFSTNSLTVPRGTKVVWQVKGDIKAWPASNNHPTHQNYPGGGGCLGSLLDACRALSSGQSFAFRFDEVGDWGLHDHLRPGSVMTVRVVGQTGIIKLASAGIGYEVWQLITGRGRDVGFAISGAPSPAELRAMDYGQQQQSISSLSQRDPAAAWRLLKEAFIVNGQVVGNVHELAHLIGNNAYKLSGVEGVRACDEAFAYGCYHGVTEQAIRSLGIEAIKQIEAQCIRAIPGGAEKQSGCLHGLGHGIAARNALEIRPSFEACDQLAEAHRSYCYDGFMMEYSESVSPDALSKTDLWSVCRRLEEQHYRACGRYMPSIWTHKLQLSDSAVFAACADAPNETLLDNCFQAMGFRLAQSNYTQPDGVIRLCNSSGHQPGSDICLLAASTELIFQGYEGWQENSQKLCRSASTAQKRDKCFADNAATAARMGRG